jgi:hypothetical protein
VKKTSGDPVNDGFIKGWPASGGASAAVETNSSTPPPVVRVNNENELLNKNFSAVLDRLNSLEARIASSLATSSGRTIRGTLLDTRPHQEKIAELRRKMALLTKSMEK